MKKQGVFLQAMAADATEAQIDIVGVIGWEVAFTELRRMFGTLAETVKRVVFNIYSPGGDVWDGNGIVQAVGELGKTRETVARVQVAASNSFGFGGSNLCLVLRRAA
jgi:ATP-dependent protease ClpP protease subunit